MDSEDVTRLTPQQEASLRELGDALVASGRGWLFAELAGETFRLTNHLRTGTEGAVILRLHRKVMLTLPPIRFGGVSLGRRRLPAGGPALTPGETGWIGTGSNRFRVRAAIVDEAQGVEYAIGSMESGGFHISKRNFDRRFRIDGAVTRSDERWWKRR